MTIVFLSMPLIFDEDTFSGYQVISGNDLKSPLTTQGTSSGFLV